MKLYKVRVEYETVIRAESQADAERDAPYVVRYDASEDPECVNADEIKSLADLPQGWNAQCLPYGERDPRDRTIGEILANT